MFIHAPTIYSHFLPPPAVHLYAGETLGLMLQRWSKLEKVYMSEAAAAVRSWGGEIQMYARTRHANCQVRNKGGGATICTRAYMYAFRNTSGACSSSNTHSVVIAPIYWGGQAPPYWNIGGGQLPPPAPPLPPPLHVLI